MSRTALLWVGVLGMAFLTATTAEASIGVAKDAERNGRQVTFDFYLENLGGSTLDPVTLTDDLDLTFGAGNYTILSGPAFVVDPGTLTLNGGFDGSADIFLVSTGTLAAGATAQISLTVEIQAVVDVGFGVGVYQNQATAVADGGDFTDLSDFGTDPDPDGNGDPGGANEDDPTVIDFSENPRLGVAKTAKLSGTEVTFDVYLENLGNRTLSSLSVPDDLDSVFGAGNYSVITGPTLIDDPGTLMVNAGFDGSGNAALLSGSLTAGATARIQFVVDITNVTDQGAGLGVYSNQVTASGTSPIGTLVADVSDAGNNPDPSGDGFAGGPDEDDPTIFVVGEQPVLGVAKNATVSASDVTLDFYLENFGDVELVTFELDDDLDSVFGAGNYEVSSGPVLIDDPGTILVNPSFDGSADTALISDGTLAIGETAQIRVVVHVFAIADQGLGFGIYSNQVTGLGTSAAGAVTFDLSDEGTDPDPSGDGDPAGAGEDDVTGFTIGELPIIGVAKRAAIEQIGSFYQITMRFTLENLGNVTLTNLSLVDDLNAVFGAGNYNNVGNPVITLVGGSGSLAGENAYDGSGNTEFLAAGFLDPRALATVQVSFRLNTITDQGFGLGTYFNQAVANADGPSGAAPSDLSDSGDITDSDGDGNPSEAGEDDPTPITLGSFLGAAEDVSVSGRDVTFDFYLEGFGTGTISEVSLSSSLDGTFGAGNYLITAAPSLVIDPGTLAVNPGFDGSGTAELIAPGGTLNAGAIAQIRLVVSVETAVNQGSGLGQYQNQAFAVGKNPSGMVITDLSDAGTDPDTDADDNPTGAGNNDITSFAVIVDPVVGVAKDASVSGTQITLDFYLENFGSVSSSDLSLVDDLDSVFGAGNYTIVTGPTLVIDPGTLVVNGAFDGSGDPNLLSAGSTMSSGAIAQIQVVVDVTTPSDQGFGTGVYRNQAGLTATTAIGLTYSELSGPGTDPDPNGDGDPTQPAATEDDSTLFFLGEPVLGAALKAYVQGTQVTLDLYLENLGDVEITGVTVRLPLNPVLGSGNYSIAQQPVQLDGAGSVTPSPQYFGFNIFDRLVLDGTLGVGQSARVRVRINVSNVTDQGSGFGVYSAQITADAFALDGVTPVSDVSDDGILTDPNGNGDPTDAGEDDATLMIIGEESTLGVALNASVTGSQVTLDYFVENLGNVTIDDVMVEDDLDAVFGAGNYNVASVDTFGSGVFPPANASFDGSSDMELFDGGGSLEAGGLVQVQVVVNVTSVVDQGLGLGNYANQVIVSGLGPSDTVAQDLSDAGVDPDPNGNGNPADVGEGDATTFFVGTSAIGVAKAASVSGETVTLDFFIENLGGLTLTNIVLTDDLDSVFGAGNYVIASAPVIVGEVHALFTNPGFNGSSETSLVTAGGSIPAGTTEQIRVIVEVINLSDQGAGFGIYSNQVTVSSGAVSDISDSGTNPDPDGDGSADEAGENDPTTFAVVENPSVGVAKAALVSGDTVTLDFYLENLGNVASSIALADDLDVVLGAGNYTVTGGPTLIVDPGTLVVNGGFNGSGDTALLAGGSTLAQGATAQVRVTIAVTMLVDQGSGVGVYANQASLTSIGPGGAMASDLSDAGTNPDPDGDGNPNEAGENDPTPFTIAENAAVGVAKTASVSGSAVTFDVYLENFGNVAPTLALADDLDSVLGSGNYTVTSGPTLISGPGTVVVNGAYDGSADTALLAGGSTLAVGATAQVRFAVAVNLLTDQGSGLGVYENQASLTATGPGGAVASDTSDAGIDSDTNGNGDPNEVGENDPTPFTIAENATAGVAKTASVSVNTVTLDFYLETFGNVEPSLALTDDLDAVFGAGNYTVTSGPTLISGPGSVVVNGSYDGSADTALLAGGSTLGAGVIAQVRVVVTVITLIDPGSGLGVYENQASLSATGPGGAVASDLSDAGTDPDPDGDGIPNEAGENDPTPFTIVENATVGVAKTASVTGSTVTMDFYLESFANVAPALTLTDDLDAVFGAGNYTLSSGPTLISGPGTVLVNGAYDGSADTALLAVGSTLAAGASAQVELVVKVGLLTDPGSGLGVYENQASLSATGPGGTVASDLSDAGTDPDANGNGDPDEAGENDPTPFSVAIDPTVGVAKSAAVSGSTVTLDFYLESLGNVDAEITLEDGLDGVFGAGNYTLTSGPTLISGPGTVVVNPGYDGSADTALLSAGSTLAAGASAQIELELTVDLLTDQGGGVGFYENQASLTATGPGATLATDLSDDGSEPDANGNGDPDEVGENDPTPIVLADDVPPTVTSLATNLGSLEECATETSRVTRFEVTIEDDKSAVLGAAETSSYLLIEAGPDAEFSTTTCGGAAGDDVEVSFTGVTLQGADPLIAEVQVAVASPGLSAGLYRFLVCDTVTDAAGNALDGDGDTVPGGDFVLSFFRADPGNQFTNGHFDNCPVTLEPWIEVATLPNFIEPGDAGVDDFEESSLSASAAFTQSAAGTSTLGQCVAISGGAHYTVESRLRFAAAPNAAAFFVRTCAFFGSADCGGASLGNSSVNSLVQDSGGEWEFFTRLVTAPAAAASALCNFTLQSVGADPVFDANLDGLGLIGTENVLFTDGFESGDTSRWSVTVP